MFAHKGIWRWKLEEGPLAARHHPIGCLSQACLTEAYYVVMEVLADCPSVSVDVVDGLHILPICESSHTTNSLGQLLKAENEL